VAPSGPFISAPPPSTLNLIPHQSSTAIHLSVSVRLQRGADDKAMLDFSSGFSSRDILLLLFLAYWALCRSLRYRRANLIANKFRGRDPYSLTIDEAQWIVDQITTKELSYISRFSTAFALFRTYGIVTIAPLLMK
jgi:phosphatidylglycerophosphatase A